MLAARETAMRERAEAEAAREVAEKERVGPSRGCPQWLAIPPGTCNAQG
jgi:hypothetical protein